MIREINRKTWSSFCRKFNSTNRFRTAQVAQSPPQSSEKSTWQTDLLGISLSKKGRMIDGIKLFAMQPDPKNLDYSSLEIPSLEKLILKKDDHGYDEGLTLISADGATTEISFNDNPDSDGYDHLVEKVAYSLSEQRGFSPGNDMDDWLKAEKIIDQICSELPD